MTTDQAGGPAPGRLFCFGLGYTAGALATALSSAGWRVAGTRRAADSERGQAPKGCEMVVFERGAPLTPANAVFARTTHLLSTIPPDDAGDPVIDRHFFDIAEAESLVWVGYLSTTGVYGDRDGAWVDEGSETKPSGERGRRRLAAEARWLDLWHGYGVPVHLFRLAGIYGPGRNPLEAVRAGTAKRIDKPGQLFSRIHVDDIVAVLRASMARPNPGAVYNVCDDEPAPAAEVVRFACDLLGVAPPPLVPYREAALSPLARSFYADNKRVRNRRIKEELGVVLRYPDYRAGLRALLPTVGG